MVSRVLPASATVVGVAALLRVAYDPWFLNYDARYSLLWARDVWTGHKPDYLADFAPTPHPLQTAVSSLALPFGDLSDDVVTWMVLLCFGALVWLTYRLGATLFASRAAGAVAALAVATRPVLERDAVLAYQDVPFAALVVGAVLLEAGRPRRGPPVLALLALAGLLRPEAWVLAGAYALYCLRDRSTAQRAGMLALAAAAPVLWALTDWLATGDLLHSLHGTTALAEAVDRRRDLEDVPYWTAQYYGAALREPLVIGVPIGLAFAWFHARRPALLPLAVVVAMTLVFAVGPLFGLPLIRRYVDTPAVLLTLFYGLAVCGWTLLPRGPARRGWLAAGVLAAALSVVYVPWHYDLLAGIERRMEADGRLYADLERAAKAPAVRAAFAACAPLTSGDRRPIPFARWWLDGPPGSVTTVTGGASPMGRMLLMPRRGPTTRRIYGPRTFPPVAVPPGQRPIYRNASWVVYAEPGCGGS